MSRMPLHLYKAELTSKKRGYSRSALRLPTGSTPRHISEVKLPPHRRRVLTGQEEAGRGPGRWVPASAPHPTRQAHARKPFWVATRHVPSGVPKAKGPAATPAQRPPPGRPGYPPAAPASAPAALTQQQQLDLTRRLLAILAEVPVDHLTPLHRRLVLGAQRTAHCARSESLLPLPSSPTRCRGTQVNSCSLDAGVRGPPDAGHTTPTHFLTRARKAKEQAAPRSSSPRPGSAPGVPRRPSPSPKSQLWRFWVQRTLPSESWPSCSL